MSPLVIPLVLIVGGALLYAVSARPAPGKKQPPPMTEEQLFQQQMLQVQREYLRAMQQLEHEARMTRAERGAVMDRMHDYHNNH
jgi:hypothetical protein